MGVDTLTGCNSMQELEKFLILKGVDDIDYGIASNIGGVVEVKYWDTNGEKVQLSDVPIKIDPGVTYFMFKAGSLQKV